MQEHMTAAQVRALLTTGGRTVKRQNEMARALAKPTLMAEPQTDVTLVVVIPLKLKNGMNQRMHWAAHARRVKAEHEAVYAAKMTSHTCKSTLDGIRFQYLNQSSEFRLLVTLTRLGGRKWDDDNNSAGLKGVRDAVAKHWLNCDDGVDWITWRYAQMPGGAVGVEVKIEAGLP